MSKLTLMLLVKNEAERYLKPMLDSASSYVDEMVILDDNSTDDTFEICSGYSKVTRIERVKNASFSEDESVPRITLWEMTKETNPEWILALDADEIMEDRFIRDLPQLLSHPTSNWYSFIFFNFWSSSTHYRTDKLWGPNPGVTSIRMIKYDPNYPYTWRQSRLHCGSVPSNIFQKQTGLKTPYRVKHYGYAGPREDHERKYNFYIERDPDSELCPRSHYDSILDLSPGLAPWVE